MVCCVVCCGPASIAKAAGSIPAGVLFWLFTLKMAEIGGPVLGLLLKIALFGFFGFGLLLKTAVFEFFGFGLLLKAALFGVFGFGLLLKSRSTIKRK